MLLKTMSGRTSRGILHFTKSLCYARSISSSPIAMADWAEKFALPSRYAGSQKSIWVEYGQLAIEHKPLNLGQGFPDYPVPAYITDALAQVAKSDNILLHQYTRGFGHPRLIAALSKLYSQLIGREINPQSEIMVAFGGYEALFCVIIGHVGAGDEVIIVEPFFDCYEPMVKAAGGTPVFIPLRPKAKLTGSSAASSAEWALDTKELEGLFNSKTKAIMVNTPNNPIGKVYSEAELQIIADLCKKWNVLYISDEVYEWMVYTPNKHVRVATLPGMWERTITIGSAGKTFNVTGWKMGWAYGPANLMHNLYMVHQNCVYTCSTPLQEAVAIAFETEFTRLGKDDCYFMSMAVELQAKRDFMVKLIAETGMRPVIPQGAYFVVANWSRLASQVDLTSEKDQYKDYRFTKWMTKNVGLQGIPATAFYGDIHKNIAENYVRYCFMKSDATLKRAADILHKWKGGVGGGGKSVGGDGCCTKIC